MPLRLPRAIIAWLLISLQMSAWGSETLIGDVGTTRFPGNQGSYGGSLTLQTTSSSGGFLFGISGTEFPVGSLTVGSLDGYMTAPYHITLSSGFAVGDAAAGAGSSTLYKAHVAADCPVAAKWSVNAADQYIDLGVNHGHLMNAGVLYRPNLKWDISATAASAVGGTLADRYGQMAANWYGPEHLFGGTVLGRTGYDPANLGMTSVIRRLVEFYVGAGIPVHKLTLTVVADDTSLDGAARQTLRFGFIEAIEP